MILLLGGSGAVLIGANAARPPINPARRYTPLWLPAMIVTELAAFWLALCVGVLGLGVALGGRDHAIGEAGAVLLLVAIALLVWILARTAVGVRRLRRHVDGQVHRSASSSWLLGRPPATPPGVAEVEHLPYADGLTADLIRPDDERSELPLLVFVHGGGWTGGDPHRSSRDVYHALALDGWATLTIRYPFAPHATVEQQIDAVHAAVAWARTQLPAHGVRPTAIALGGGSAGGLLAATTALRQAGEAGVDALVGIYGVYDLANRHRTHARWLSVEKVVMQARYDEIPDRYEAVSPIDHVGDHTPPVLLVHGSHDTLVPFAEATLFERVLREAGRPVDLIRVHGAQHAYDAIGGITSRTAAAAIRTWLRRTVPEPNTPQTRSATNDDQTA